VKVPANHIIVEVEKTLEDSITTKGGGVIHIDVKGIEDEKYTRKYGTVVAACDKITSDVEIRSMEENILHSNTSYPYHSNNVVSFKEGDIPPDIKVGDKVYFYYTAIDHFNAIDINGKKCFMIRYPEVVCAVRDGEIIPVSGHVLIEPYWGADVKEETINGGLKRMVRRHGELIELVDKPLDQYGIVKHICSPLRGDEIGFDKKDPILFQKKSDVLVEIEGREYYAIQYWHALSIVELEKEI